MSRSRRRWTSKFDRRKVEDGDHAQDQLLRATGDSVTVRKDKSENERLVLDIPAWKWG